MGDWRKRVELTGDVAFFGYVSSGVQHSVLEVYVWDLDKTYLDTAIDSIRGLLQTLLEKALQKKNVPGTASLVRALRSTWQEHFPDSRDFPIYFVTASPPQMEEKIHQKLNLDGIYPFGIFFKDNLKNFKPSRFPYLRLQLGYKLQALLQLRLHLGENVRQVLWGDDSEMDAVIYSLYSDVCSRRLHSEDLADLLRFFKVSKEQIETILELQDVIPVHDPVDKVYINLATDTDPDYYLKFGRRTLATTNAFQVALDLYQDGRLKIEQVAQVAEDLQKHYGFTVDQFESSYEDMIYRPQLGLETHEKLLPYLQDKGVLSRRFHMTVTPRKILERRGERVILLEGHREPWVPDYIDYSKETR